jgi:putative flippase GtrA
MANRDLRNRLAELGRRLFWNGQRLASGLGRVVATIRCFAKYVTVGAGSTVTDFATLWILTEFFTTWYLISSVTGSVLGMLFGFCFNKRWTFPRSQGGMLQQFSKFGAVVIMGQILANAGVYCFVEYVGLHYIVAKAISTTAVLLLWGFPINLLWTFRPEPAGVADTNIRADERSQR